jgi:hypothetical protein
VDRSRLQGVQPHKIRRASPRRGCRTLRAGYWYVEPPSSLSGARLTPTSSPAGKDSTQAFYGLHRHEVLLRPQYARLQIGTIKGETALVQAVAPEALSGVPYAEPTWLSKGYHSPYYNDSHRKFQQAVRKFVQEEVYPEAVKCEEKGTRISQELVNRLA